MATDQHIVTLSCPNQPGIVARVSTLLFLHRGNILEAHQFDDIQTGRFFLQMVFNLSARRDAGALIAAYLSGRCITIHHSFLLGFKGAKPYHQAHSGGVKLIGATAHDVTADLDEGPIIEQDVERVSHQDSPDDLVRKGRDIERRVLARAVAFHLDGRALSNGSTTVVFRG